MKKILFSLTVLILGLFFLNSCTNFDDTHTSLTLTFRGSDFAGRTERNITTYSHDEAWYFVVNIGGDYKESKSVYFDDNETIYTIKFNRVPVGVNVFVQANVYRPLDKDHMHYYSGRSEDIKISSGDNFVNINLKNLQVSCNEQTLQIYSQDEISYEGIPGVGLMLTFYYNEDIGKYRIVNDITTEVISEGLFSGNMYAGEIYVTECICSAPVLSWYSENSCWNYTDTGNNTIITESKEQVIAVTENSSDPSDPNIIYDFYFKSHNGLEMHFKKQ